MNNRPFAARFRSRTGREIGAGVKMLTLVRKTEGCPERPACPGTCINFPGKPIEREKECCLKKQVEKNVFGDVLLNKAIETNGSNFRWCLSLKWHFKDKMGCFHRFCLRLFEDKRAYKNGRFVPKARVSGQKGILQKSIWGCPKSHFVVTV